MYNYTFTPSNTLIKPYMVRGAMINHATITVRASSLEEAKARFQKCYEIGVDLGYYKAN